jgi:membrane fusion protein (multidrug efflux system)
MAVSASSSSLQRPKAGGLAAVGSALLLAGIAGCSEPAKPAAPPVVDVKAIEVKPQDTTLYIEKVGEVRGSQEVDLHSQASGVLLKQHFQDGALVEQGQLLFTIDAREYRAQLANVQAQLAAAEANLARARQDVERYTPLVAENAISRQVYDAAVATERQAAAQVEASKAAIAEAKLGIEYTEVRAPLTGRIGAALVFEGALVTAGVTELTSLSKDDPAWVYFTVSEAELLDYQRRYGADQPSDTSTLRTVSLELSDGSTYAQPGHINFGARALDAATGTYGLRAEFPNPQHRLIPGLFARVRITAEELHDTIAVPDRAVQQQLGRYFVTVVGAESKAEVRAVKPGPRLGNLWVIEDGLKAGDRVVVEGIQKARPGMPLNVTSIDPAALTPDVPANTAPGA